MKKVLTTEESYRHHIMLAMQYIEENLDKKIDINMLSAVSGFSPFHLHRILKAHTGESIGAFITRKRVETAAKLLLYSNMSISDIAYRVGYNVPTSLSKAFVKHYGISPTQYKKVRKSPIYKYVNRNSDVNIESYDIVELPDINIICVGFKGNRQQRDFGSVYKDLTAELNRQKIPMDDNIYLCLFYDNPNTTCEDDRYNEISIGTHQEGIQPNDKIETKRVQGGRYAKFCFSDSLSKLDSVYDKIYSEMVEELGITFRNNCVFERYATNLEGTTPNTKVKIEIFIPIE
ncbi:MAG: AraC family transcriptional regulator [Rikenellaceae bacterium]